MKKKEQIYVYKQSRVTDSDELSPEELYRKLVSSYAVLEVGVQQNSTIPAEDRRH